MEAAQGEQQEPQHNSAQVPQLQVNDANAIALLREFLPRHRLAGRADHRLRI